MKSPYSALIRNIGLRRDVPAPSFLLEKIFRLGQESGMKKQTKISLTNGNKKRGDGKKIMESSHHFSLIKNMD